MTGLESIVQGILQAIGMFIVLTVLSILSFLTLKKWFIKTITEIWVKVKEEGFKIDNLEIDGSLRTKKIKKRRRKKMEIDIYKPDGYIDENKFAKEISVIEGKLKEVDIAQIKEILKITLDILAHVDQNKIDELLQRHK